MHELKATSVQVVRPSLADALQLGQVSGGGKEAPESPASLRQTTTSLQQPSQFHKYFKSTFIFVLSFAVFIRILQIVQILWFFVLFGFFFEIVPFFGSSWFYIYILMYYYWIVENFWMTLVNLKWHVFLLPFRQWIKNTFRVKLFRNKNVDTLFGGGRLTTALPGPSCIKPRRTV